MIHQLSRQPTPGRLSRRATSTTLLTFLLAPLLVGPTAAQVPFQCTGESFIAQRQPSQLFRFFQTQADAFAFSVVGTGVSETECTAGVPAQTCNLQFPPSTFIEVNNLSFRSTDGLLYAVHLNKAANTNFGLVSIDSNATVFAVGTPTDGGGTWPDIRLDAGDISQDGTEMYVNQAGGATTFAIVDLTTSPPTVVASPTIVGDTGIVNDWAYNRIDGNLYAGDRDDGQVARLNLADYKAGVPPAPAMIVREDFDVLGCNIPGVCIAPELPSVPLDPGASGAFGAFGGSWFNASGTLFLYRNTCQPGTGEADPCDECATGAPPPSTCVPPAMPGDPWQNGKLYRIDLSGPMPQIERTRIGRDSEGFNDSAACLRFPRFGPAKQMTATCGLPSTVTIEYVVENFELATGGPDADLIVSELSAIEDLAAVFGVHGVDWTFTSIASAPAAFANPGFDGFSDTQLINQMPTQSLGPEELATVTVEIEVLTLANADMTLPNPPPSPPLPSGSFCNQIQVDGVNFDGVNIGDLSTVGLDPDPDGNMDPDEALISCVTLADPAVTLDKVGTFDDGGDGPQAGDLINYTFTVSNPDVVGATTVEDLTISDPLVGTIDCGGDTTPPQIASLAPGDPDQICTGSYAITAGDIGNAVMNTATITGTPFLPSPPYPPPPFGDTCPVADSDDHTETIPGGVPPCIDLSKSCDADLGPDGIAQPGEIIDYDFEVINCGDVTLTNVVINDPMVSIDCSPLTNGAITLLPMTSAFCTGTYVITQADIDAGEKCNIATATGNDPAGAPVPTPPEEVSAEACCQLPSFVIPTLGHLGLLLLALGLAGVGLRRLRRRD